MQLGDFERVTETHVYFVRGPFSQWFKCKFTADDIEFNSAEQYMMFRKAQVFGDSATAELIMKSSNMKEIKEYGRQVSNYNESIWESIRYLIVVQGNLLKFTQNQDLAEYLLSSNGKVLVEAAHYDKIWGVGLRETDDAILDYANWKGLNLLGNALMSIRPKIAISNKYFKLIGNTRLETADNDATLELAAQVGMPISDNRWSQEKFKNVANAIIEAANIIRKKSGQPEHSRLS